MARRHVAEDDVRLAGQVLGEKAPDQPRAGIGAAARRRNDDGLDPLALERYLLCTRHADGVKTERAADSQNEIREPPHEKPPVFDCSMGCASWCASGCAAAFLASRR